MCVKNVQTPKRARRTGGFQVDPVSISTGSLRVSCECDTYQKSSLLVVGLHPEIIAQLDPALLAMLKFSVTERTMTDVSIIRALALLRPSASPVSNDESVFLRPNL